MSKQAYADAIQTSKMRKPSKPPELRAMEIEKAGNGGHIITHRMTQGDGPYIEPKPHVFGADEGKKALAHIAEHMGIKIGKGESEAGDSED